MLTLIQLLLTTLPSLGLSNAPVPIAAPSDGLVSLLSGLDCNGNGIEDSVDIAIGTSGDLDQNGIPDECQASVMTVEIAHSSAGEVGLRLPRPLKASAAQSPPRSGFLPVPWFQGRRSLMKARPPGLDTRVP